ncbi:MAG: hypothetical protein PHW73_01925 [Atribacterota bacterium]|nr:hypothetical protein [Atribacterota bacterium]
MTKAILQFNLPEDADDLTLAEDGLKWWSVSKQLDQYLRDELKYHSNKYTVKEIELLQRIRDKLNELILDEVGIADIYSYVE